MRYIVCTENESVSPGIAVVWEQSQELVAALVRSIELLAELADAVRNANCRLDMDGRYV